MEPDWCPAMRRCCRHWPYAPMLEHTFQALERSLEDDSDACIDCSKSTVEVICRTILTELGDPTASAQSGEPKKRSFGEWVTVTVNQLGLRDYRQGKFHRLLSQHRKLALELGELRNLAGPTSHGRDGFITPLTAHHRRIAVLSADAIVAILFEAYMETELDPRTSREPYERFTGQNNEIDRRCTYQSAKIGSAGTLDVGLVVPASGGGTQVIEVQAPVSRFLFQLTRGDYEDAVTAIEQEAAGAEST